MTGSEIANMYEFSYGAIKRNLEDVTNEESLVQPPGAGNCLNWVLGHIVAARNTALKLAGGSSAVWRRGGRALSSRIGPAQARREGARPRYAPWPSERYAASTGSSSCRTIR